MRSITLKLVFAFVAISLISIVLLFLSVRYTTAREFRQFTENNERSTVMDTLQAYYAVHGSWEGIDTAELVTRFPAPKEGEPPKPYDPMTVTDGSGKVLRAGSNFQLGDVIPIADLRRGTPIQVDGQTVGHLIFSPPPFGENSPERDFLNRTTLLLTYSALAAMAMALILGIVLSRTLTSPIRELTLATQAISKGDLNRQVQVYSDDELGELAAAFNKMSADLARSTNARRQMTADIAHELRTPLSLILGHAEAVRDRVLPPSLENFEIIREEAERLEHLVDELRTISLADAGELSIEKQPLEIKKLLQDIASVYLHRVQQKAITLELDFPTEFPSIQADANRITQVITNILDNAIRYTPENGKIILSAKEVDAGVQVSIKDSGPGLEAEQASHIFDRFYRVDPSRTREEGGSGLGLAIARSIVQAHGGRIWAESAVGQGLSVFIVLPMSSR